MRYMKKLRSFIVFPLVCSVTLLFPNCTPKITTGSGTSASTTATPVASKEQQKNPSSVVARRGEVLFLGHASKHHDAQKYAPWLAIQLFKTGINLTYTNELSDLNEANLSKYDGLIIYANHERISPSQESALKTFVEGGKGLIPLHSATACFKNSEWYVKAVGGQ